METNKVGTTRNWVNANKVDFSKVFVAHEGDSAQTINAKLNEGLHVVIQPGNYYLTDSIKVNRPDTVVLGLGMATLISNTGKPCIEVANVEGVRIAGLLLQAGPQKADSLLKWGQSKNPGSSQNPGVASDVFARVGGPNNPYQQQVHADKMFQINTGNVIIDNTWLWRADHGVSGSVKNSMNPVATGIEVNGDNVIAYGLAVEHTLGHMTVWNGDNGLTIFYQSEFPYDVDQSYGSKYVGYLVADHVQNHKAYGVGTYSFFRDHSVYVSTGIRTPNKPGIHFVNSFTRFLSGQGGISHVINGQGGSTHGGAALNYVCNYGGANLLMMQLQNLQYQYKPFVFQAHPEQAPAGNNGLVRDHQN